MRKCHHHRNYHRIFPRLAYSFVLVVCKQSGFVTCDLQLKLVSSSVFCSSVFLLDVVNNHISSIAFLPLPPLLFVHVAPLYQTLQPVTISKTSCVIKMSQMQQNKEKRGKYWQSPLSFCSKLLHHTHLVSHKA